MWAASIGAAESHANILRLRLSLLAWAVSASWIWCTGNLYLVYRSIGSVHVPRRLANIEIVEALPRQYLLYGVIGLGLVLALATSHDAGDWWSARVLAGRGPEIGRIDPILNRDLSYYLYVLPWQRLLHGFATLLSVTMVGVTMVLYVAVGAIALRGRRLWVSGLARRHLGCILAMLAIALFVGYRLEPAEFVAGIHPVPIDTVLTDIRLTTSRLLSGLAVLAAVVSVLWIRFDRLAILAFGWISLTAFSIMGHYVVPAVAAGSRRPDELRVERLHRESARLLGVAFGLDGTDTIVTGEGGPMPRGAPDAAMVWDPFELTVFLNAAVPGDPAFRFFDTSIGAYQGPDSSAVPVALAVRELDVQFLRQLAPEMAWERLHTGSYARALGVWGLRADLVAPDGSPFFVSRPEHPHITASEPTPVEVGGDILFTPASTSFAVVSANDGDLAGVALDRWLRRIALAWKLQSPRLLRRSAAPRGAFVLWDRAVISRLQSLAPFAEFGRAYPAIVNDRVYWLAPGYVSSEGFPLVPSVRWRGRSVRYLRAGLLGIVDAESGASTIALMPGADPLSSTWAALTPDLIKSWDQLPPPLASLVRYPAELFELQLQILRSADAREPDDAWPRSLPDDTGGPVPFWRVADSPSDTVPRLRVGAALERGEPAVLSAIVDAFIVSGHLTLDLYRLRPPLNIPGPSQVAARFATELGSDGHVPGTVRTLLTPWGVLSLQPVYSAAGPDAQPPRLTTVFAAFAGGTRGVGRGRTATTAIQRARETPMPGLGPDAAWSTARTWFERLDSARRNGDWVEFGRAYQELLQLFGITPSGKK
jgi:uncharacterized protein